MEGVYTFTEAELKAFHESTVKLAAKEAVSTIRKEFSKESIRKKEIEVIRGKMAAYRRHKRDMQEDVDFTADEKFEYRLAFLEDLMDARNIDTGRTEETLLAMEAKRRNIYYEMQTLDAAIEKYYQELDENDDVERARWFNVLVMFYVNDEPKTMDEVAEELNISRATAWRDLRKACAVLLEYIV